MAPWFLARPFGALVLAGIGFANPAAKAHLLDTARIVAWAGASTPFGGAALKTALRPAAMKNTRSGGPDFRDDVVRVWASDGPWYVLPLDPVSQDAVAACPPGAPCAEPPTPGK
ncbi:hypothetical protein [Jiella sp. M17.18]|uniref:hypothetical protein n=1 Tax=Jiella sp. M17.18 TaxID=3234247 RepID=UPI0034DFCC19